MLCDECGVHLSEGDDFEECSDGKVVCGLCFDEFSAVTAVISISAWGLENPQSDPSQTEDFGSENDEEDFWL